MIYWRLYDAPLLWCLDEAEEVIWMAYVIYPFGLNGTN